MQSLQVLCVTITGTRTGVAVYIDTTASCQDQMERSFDLAIRYTSGKA